MQLHAAAQFDHARACAARTVHRCGRGQRACALHARRVVEILGDRAFLIEPGGAITGQDTKLFVRASAANLAQLQRALTELDKPLRQLRVSVRRATQQEVERDEVRASATVRGTNGGISINESTGNPSGARVRVTESRGENSRSGVAVVQVLEGGAAFIASGQSVPIVTAVAVGAGRRPWTAASLEYRNLSSGALVRPRLAGDRVTIDVSQHTEANNGRDSGQITSQSIETQAAGRVGEWIRLGGVEEVRSSRERAPGGRQYTTASDALSVWVKVEVTE